MVNAPMGVLYAYLIILRCARYTSSWGFRTLLVSTYRGNARAYTSWNEQNVRLHVFRFVTYIKFMYNISFEAKD